MLIMIKITVTNMEAVQEMKKNIHLDNELGNCLNKNILYFNGSI